MFKKAGKQRRYEYLLNARNFHYENFNRWTNYFCLATGALFIGYYNLIDKNKSTEEIMVLVLGYIISLFWYWSAKGYYYWYINFIKLINDCETKLNPKKRVYFVFADKKAENNYCSPISGANISTSKVAILFPFIVALFWGFLLFSKFCNLSDCKCVCCKCLAFFSAVMITLLLSCLIPKSFLKSNIDDYLELKD
ncbi:hypothetical protein PG279_07345 [Riemerella anatipestifer]|nr:hypothetical protein [Riemerella anatipestifer]